MEMGDRVQTILLNVWFYSFFLVVHLVLVPVLVLAGLAMAPFCSWRRTLANVRELIKVYGRTVMFLGWPFIRIRVERETKPPEPCIYICNHRSTTDGFLMGMQQCEGIQVVNVWPFKIPVLGFFAKLAGYLSIREMPPEEFMQRAAKRLQEGVSVIAFPEGTRSGNRQMGSFHGALFRLALKTGAPLVPICLSGTEDKPRKGSVVLHPGLIRMRFLSPIMAETYQGMGAFKLKNFVRDRMVAELEKMESSE